jgi:peptide subunit release factor RF-3
LAIARLRSSISFDECLGRIEGHIEIEGNPMSLRQRRYNKEELAQRGQELYESSIRQQVEAGNEGKIVAIDIETGEFEVGDTVMAATNRLFERQPNAQPWGIRIGCRSVYRFGSRSLKKSP